MNDKALSEPPPGQLGWQAADSPSAKLKGPPSTSHRAEMHDTGQTSSLPEWGHFCPVADKSALSH